MILVTIRIGKRASRLFTKTKPEFTIGKGITLQEGKDACLLCRRNRSGPSPWKLLDARLKGISARVVSFHTIKRWISRCSVKVFSKFKVVATIEEHSVLGGLGGSVAEWLSDQPKSTGRLIRVRNPG